MYARSYGTSPRSARSASDQLPRIEQQNTDPDQEAEEHPQAKNTSVNSTSNDRAKTDTPPDTPSKSRENRILTDTSPETRFGEHGIPPQPLRRRKLPAGCKPNTTRTAQPTQEEHHAPTPTSCSATEAPHTTEIECCHKEESPIRGNQPCHSTGFSSEELLLAGLLLLLINDRANDDILLILAFLLVCRFSED